MKLITETTKIKDATWVSIQVNNNEVAMVWADTIEVSRLTFGLHYSLSYGDSGIIAFANTPAKITIKDSCEIIPVEVKTP